MVVADRVQVWATVVHAMLARDGAMMRQVRHVSLLLLIFFGSLSGRAFGLNWSNGLSGAGASLSDTGNALMQQELQRQLLEQQHQQQMQENQAQHDLQMQQLQEQQKALLEQQQRLAVDRQRAEQRTAVAAKSKAIDAAQLAHLVKTYPDWRAIVGAVDVSKQQPDPNNAFRKWLATKDAAYQKKINGTTSPREVEKAIALFQAES